MELPTPDVPLPPVIAGTSPLVDDPSASPTEASPLPLPASPLLGAWRFAGVSSVGTSHIDSGVVCQDSHAVEVITGPDGMSYLLAVASDGAGSAKLSHLGSRIVCDQMMKCMRHAIAAGQNLADFLRPDVEEWLQIALAAVVSRATEEGVSTRELAATCLAVVVTPSHLVAVQIGDGAVVIDDGVTGYRTVFWPMRGEFANETVFLCHKSAIAQADFTVLAQPVRDLAVFTDGIQMVALHYDTKTAPASFWDPLFSTMAAQPTGSSPGLDAALGGLLGRPAILARTDDDRTLILGCRR